ncbi:heme/copper-type cytochrome/quinol oxidase, subunit 1 [Saccharomonospora marina XMU15]|uniref:Heme/copper-type cytochrome/quinol oxidase, subunit 1 n=1 Tax=Saccharomonospora marina XMU15 TaxID=882083 RepID=H5X8N2_9PSEU|nr:cytochrome c oxidase subunit I [Saccharomonospora marina]EHR51401.1 heme/copper-type cytochrome/quinol oxidase, subunit 1 [Saccharomonospora marina XMU15]
MTAELDTVTGQAPSPSPSRSWVATTDHKRIALLTIGTALLLMFGMGALALVMRAQLAQPELGLLSNDLYNQLFTIHGSGMIYLVITPLAVAFGLYLVPLQVGAPAVAAPRLTMLGYWLYAGGAVTILAGFVTTGGAAKEGWTAYTPLSTARFSPGFGTDLWLLGTFAATVGTMLMAATVLWTVLLKRTPGMTMLRIPVFSWSMVATNLMVLAAFPSLLIALGMIAVGRTASELFTQNVFNIGYQHLFWFYGHPVVYVMFFPFVGAVAEVLSTFAGRRFFGYKATVLSLLAFAALSMSVWGHHMFTTGQVADNYYSLTSIMLLVPAGIEYLAMLGTIIGAKLRLGVPMLFALAFIPQFLVGGLTGIMVGTPVVDYQMQDSYFVVAHFHYTLVAGSLFGLFAGFYFWFPKATGVLLGKGLGHAHFWLMVAGTNVTFLPMFWLGVAGMPRRVATYLPTDGFGSGNLIATIGSGLLGLGMLAFALNIVLSLARRKRVASDNPWRAHTLEWATSSPPPPHNFDADHPIPPIRSFTPLLDLRKEGTR